MAPLCSDFADRKSKNAFTTMYRNYVGMRQSCIDDISSEMSQLEIGSRTNPLQCVGTPVVIEKEKEKKKPLHTIEENGEHNDEIEDAKQRARDFYALRRKNRVKKIKKLAKERGEPVPRFPWQGKKCRTAKHKKKNADVQFSPHCGLECLQLFPDFFHDLAKYAKVDITDAFISEVEGVVALFVAVAGCTDYMSIAASIFLYARKFSNKSISSQVLEFVCEILETEMSSQDGKEDEVVPVKPAWLDMMRDARTNWELVKANKLFKQFSRLLSLCVTLGMCQASTVTFNIREYKVFEPDLTMIHANTLDLIDAAFSTITYFVENIYECFHTGSLRPFLINDKEAVELDEEYNKIIVWWDLVKNGNLEKIAKISEAEFDKRLESCATKFKLLTQNKQSSFNKKLIDDKYVRLCTIKNEYVTLKVTCGMRPAPFALELFGESNQGKTTCGEQIVDCLLKSADLPLGKEYRASINAGDKFMSNWTTNKLVMVIDDIANEKEAYVEKPPTRFIVDVCNNNPFYANKADLASKGQVFVEPKVVLVNTNKKSLDAFQYSNCPYSIQRRMNYVITVKAKPEFQLQVDGVSCGVDTQKVREHYEAIGGDKPSIDDIWNLTVEKAVQPRQMKDLAKYVVVDDHYGRHMKDVSIHKVVEFLITEFETHRNNQKYILECNNSRSKGLSLCGIDGCRNISGCCTKHRIDPHDGYEFGDDTSHALVKLTDTFSKNLLGFEHCVDGALSLVIIQAARHFSKHWNWVKFVPTPWLHNRTFCRSVMLFNKKKVMRLYAYETCKLWSFFLCACYLFWCYCDQLDEASWIVWSFILLYFLVAISNQKKMIEIVEESYRKQLLNKNVVAPIMQEWRDTYGSNLCAAIGIAGTIYALARLYRRFRAISQQGSLAPETQEDIDARDSEESPWTKITTRELPVTKESMCMTHSSLRHVVEKNLVYGSLGTPEGVFAANGLFLTSNVIVIPNHYFQKYDTLNCTFRKKEPDKTGGKFATRLCVNSSYRIPGTDFRVCYSPTGGSFKDITRWLPLENLPSHHFSMVWRRKDGSMWEAEGLSNPHDEIDTKVDTKFLGQRYVSLTENTFKGLCGATLISHGRGPCISGLHLGGNANTPSGASGTLLQKDALQAIQELKKIEGVIISGSGDKFEAEVLGVKIVDDTQEPCAKSPMNYLPHGSQIEYYGKCPGASTSKSDVKVTPISEHVMMVCDAPNIYGPPKMKPDWYGWQACLSTMAIPALPYEHKLLSRCVLDYKEALVGVFKSSLWCNARPLTDDENLCGIDGKKFIDSINLSTSIGFPLSGKKRKYVRFAEANEERQHPREFDDVIVREVERCLGLYKQGIRAFTVAKACKKDEILSKDKCRIFFGNPIALTFLIRKYFLPIVRVLQMNPLRSECAVGINCHGPEWNEFYAHVLARGTDRIIGGDYKNYDQFMPSQLIFASLRILIDFARLCDYKEEDLNVMETMCGDIVYSIIAFNGDLVGLTEGGHISGNSLTVVINGICGSLNARACFFTIYPDTSFNFRQAVNFMTYGDDNIGTVDEDFTEFNIKSMSKFLKSYGQIYTMPDKDSELTEFLKLEEFEFLKRKSVYHESLGLYLGALVEKSIFKSLHCYMRPKGAPLSERHAAAMNMDTALLEWFNHGEDVYENRREQMKLVAELADLTHLCTRLDETYQQRVEMWKEKYES